VTEIIPAAGFAVNSEPNGFCRVIPADLHSLKAAYSLTSSRVRLEYGSATVCLSSTNDAGSHFSS
jgi:hypothetical protein